MAVYLGSSGCVELKRTQFDEVLSSVVNPSDVNLHRETDSALTLTLVR